mmetsp:Transcript_7169/g.17470  ORF Transcript_7169/g.17470 Transcript_7169/m.17470 type:complete len:1075 (-) Transcript_7169:74-3298(-)
MIDRLFDFMMMSFSYYFLAIYTALVLETIIFVASHEIDFNCDPCIDRPSYRIRAIVHGTNDDMFWQRLRASSIQAAKDMRVQLDFDLYDEYNPELMARDIEAASTGPFPPDALIVTIPSPTLEPTIAKATEYVPVFGMNSGYDLANRVGVLDFVAMDEYKGGLASAREFLKENRNITRALFVNHNKGNTAIDRRIKGLSDGLGEGVIVTELVVNVTQADNAAAEYISSEVGSCNYDAILLAGSAATLEMTIEALTSENCSNKILLGTFDESLNAYAAVATGKLLFLISQQTHLQGTLSVVAAATYATTEKKLSSSQESFGTYLSGPVVINFDDLKTDTLQICEEAAFPVCSSNSEPDSKEISPCDCLDRSKIKIAGVLHGVTTDPFWDIVFEQATQAADDLGVELKLDRLKPQKSAEVWHSKMALQIISLCDEGVDGIFITIPSELVHPAIQRCQSLNIPVISINSGASDAQELNITHHISQLEYQAGFEAGSRMATEGITRGICLNHEPDNTAIFERCNGFEAGLMSVSSNISYSLHNVPLDSKLIFYEILQNIVSIEDDWDGIGALANGGKILNALMEVKELHPKLVVGTFDTSDEIFEYLDRETLLFGIDQNPFMQGYMPVWLLTIMAHTKQHLKNQFIETGPRLIENAPSDALKTCSANNFGVCPRPVDYKLNQIARIRPYGLALAVALMSLSLGLLAWICFNRNAAVVRKSQPLFLGMICVGTFLMAATIIPLSVDDSIATTKVCTVACNATPWFLWIGFVITFSALFSKIYRINKLIKSSSNFRRVTITVWDVMPTFCILLTLTLIFLSVWTFADPMYWIRREVDGSTDDLSTFGSCELGRTKISIVMLSCLSFLAFACVVLACAAAWHGRNVNVEYSESRYVTMIIIAMLQAFPIGIPLIIISSSNPTATYFVKVAIIFVLTITVLLLIFVPKILFLRRERTVRGGRVSTSGGNLRVMGRNQFVPRMSGVTTTSSGVVSGITKKNLEDLSQNLIKCGTIDDTTDLRSIFKRVGIIILDEGGFQRSDVTNPRHFATVRNSTNLEANAATVRNSINSGENLEAKSELLP